MLVEPLTRADSGFVDAVIEARRTRQTVVVVTRIADGGRKLYSSSDSMPPEVASLAASGSLALIETPDGEAFVQPLLPPLRIIVAGATHIGQVFAELARQVGYAVTVVDPRSAFATEERFGAAGAMAEWPQASFDQLGIDARTAVVALTHAAHIDDEALHFHINDGEIDVQQGETRHADVVLHASMQNYMGLLAGVIDPDDAISRGEIRVEGNLDVLRRFLQLCALPSAIASQEA